MRSGTKRASGRMPWSAMWIGLLILLPSCGGTGPEIGDFCDLGGPVRITPPPEEYAGRFMPDERPGQFDRLTVETAREILRNNLTGRALCRW